MTASAARDSDTPEQVGVIAAELAGLTRSHAALTRAQAEHGVEMRERLDALTTSHGEASERIDRLHEILEADRAEREVERARLAELATTVRAVQANDGEQETLRQRVTWTGKVIVWLVPIVMGLIGSLAGWQLHATQVGRETDAELRTRVERAEADVQAHGIEDDEEHRRAATERRETAEALRELTGEIRSWRESQAEDVRAIGEGVRRLEVQVRRGR